MKDVLLGLLHGVHARVMSGCKNTVRRHARLVQTPVVLTKTQDVRGGQGIALDSTRDGWKKTVKRHAMFVQVIQLQHVE